MALVGCKMIPNGAIYCCVETGICAIIRRMGTKIVIHDMKTVGDAVRAERKAQRASQTMLAQFANVGLRFVRDVENGKESVNFGKLSHVLMALGLELSLDVPGDR